MTERTGSYATQSIATFDAGKWCFPPDKISIQDRMTDLSCGICISDDLNAGIDGTNRW